MEKVLVAGAHGTTGQKIISLLKESQYFTPIAMVRNQEQAERFKSKGVTSVVADLENDLTHATKGVDKVIFAAGSKGKNLKAVDQEGAKRLIDASKTNEVKKFVMLSSIGAEHPEKSDQLVDYLKAKHNADEYLKDSGLKYAIVRPGTLNNETGNGKIKLAEILESRGDIPREDVAQTLVRALHDDTANDAVFEIITGEVLIGEALDQL
ncbi:SDR family oxidoreductase [Euzebyella saccharophila]|uniref:SDR family oxidoreductase n=1 Tax=Euzebyella saccharophila TaxID=679664 RepID=A0ABV8JT12_9FLAO|nr:SDR family oxidoreductase [Euzebyella saccharophila]